jgi:GTPase SAR1 family protein
MFIPLTGPCARKVKNSPVKVNYFDLAGAPAFADVRCEFYSDTGAVMLVFDLTSRKSFLSLAGWLDEAQEHAPTLLETATVVVFGNKASARVGTLTSCPASLGKLCPRCFGACRTTSTS